jgi:hypothetical protein
MELENIVPEEVEIESVFLIHTPYSDPHHVISYQSWASIKVGENDNYTNIVNKEWRGNYALVYN